MIYRKLPFVVALVGLYLIWRRRRKVFSCKGRYALVTGGGRGIGREIAEQLLRRGANVILWDICEEVGNTCNELREKYPDSSIMFEKVDVSDQKVVFRAAEQLKGNGIAISIVVNNAGVLSGSDVVSISPADVSRTFGVNTFSHFWVLQQFLPGMIESKDGYCVGIASVMSTLGSARLSDYCASKWAVAGLYESLRMELLNTGVQTMLVNPGIVKTSLFEGIFSNASLSMKIFQWITPWLDPTYVAQEVVRGMECGTASLFLPAWAGFAAPICHMMPVSVSDKILEATGGYCGMDGWKGYQLKSQPKTSPTSRAASIQESSNLM